MKNRIIAYLNKTRRPWDGPNGEHFRKWFASGQHLKYIKNKQGKLFSAAEIKDVTDLSLLGNSSDKKDMKEAAEQSEKDRDKEYWREKDDSDEDYSTFDFDFLEDEMKALGINSDSIETWSDKVLSTIGL